MSTEQNNQEVVQREGFGSKIKKGAKAVWDFTGPARKYVVDVACATGMYAAAGAAMVGGMWFMADKLMKDTDPDSDSEASDVSAEDTTPEE